MNSAQFIRLLSKLVNLNSFFFSIQLPDRWREEPRGLHRLSRWGRCTCSALRSCHQHCKFVIKQKMLSQRITIFFIYFTREREKWGKEKKSIQWADVHCRSCSSNAEERECKKKKEKKNLIISRHVHPAPLTPLLGYTTLLLVVCEEQQTGLSTRWLRRLATTIDIDIFETNENFLSSLFLLS